VKPFRAKQEATTTQPYPPSDGASAASVSGPSCVGASSSTSLLESGLLVGAMIGRCVSRFKIGMYDFNSINEKIEMSSLLSVIMVLYSYRTVDYDKVSNDLDLPDPPSYY
jgi:hypothetical protein